MKVKAKKEAQLRRGDNIMSLISTSDITANLDVRVHDLDMVRSLFQFFQCSIFSTVQDRTSTQYVVITEVKIQHCSIFEIINVK